MIDLSSYAERSGRSPVAVFGLGGSGLPVVRALCAAKVPIYAGDDRPDAVEQAVTFGARALSSSFSEIQSCSHLVLNPAVPLDFPAPHPVVVAAKAAGTKIIGDIELFSYAGTGNKTIGVTGTNGKSTTTALIAHVLISAGKKAIPCGNIGVPIFDITIDDPETVIVIEMSSFQIDLCLTFAPDIAIHLNITPDHLDRHGSLAHYTEIKRRIFRGTGLGLCGIDDEESLKIFESARTNLDRKMTPVSCARVLEDGLFLAGSDIDDMCFEKKVMGSLAHLPTLRGRHNHQNCLMAYGAARAVGLDPKVIFDAFQTYPGLPHRQLRVRTLSGVEYINDSKATNADATDKALVTFNDIHWIVGGLQKAGGLSGLEQYRSKIRQAYLIGSSSSDFASFMKAHHIPFTLCDTLENAVAAAHHCAQADIKAGKTPGVVLLSPACASFDQFKSYEHRGKVFTQLVEKLGETPP